MRLQGLLHVVQPGALAACRELDSKQGRFGFASFSAMGWAKRLGSYCKIYSLPMKLPGTVHHFKLLMIPSYMCIVFTKFSHVSSKASRHWTSVLLTPSLGWEHFL